jgi:hypothetical protein
MFRISNGPFQGGATEWCDTRGACPSVLAGIDGSHDVYPHPVVIRLAQQKAFGHFLAHKHATEQPMSFNRQPATMPVWQIVNSRRAGSSGKEVE